MNVKHNRFWIVRLLRLPATAEHKLSTFIHRIPPRTRLSCNFTLLSVATAWLISHSKISAMPQWGKWFGLTFAVAGIFFALFQAATRSKSLRLPPETTFWVAALAVFLQTAFTRVGYYFAETLTHNADLSEHLSTFGFELAIPFAACALVLSLLVGSQIALVAALVSSLFAAFISDAGIAIGVYSLVGSVAAIAGSERYRSRNAISIEVLVIGSVNALMSLVMPFIAGQPVTLRSLLNGVLLGFISGLQVAAIVSLIAPVFESAFEILTDMKLLELSSADNPLLRDLAIKTPGTHHHSFIVATLAESAAKAIGANDLLAKTACLYHDIGKMAAPKMYIENQNGMENPHNQVTARDSVRIVTGHVRRGIKMAQEFGLPQQIIDFIPQHHGTRILAYFYHKAKSDAEACGETVDPADFRYPGPKPQTKEAVIVMLADGSEAAVRSLHEHSIENIRAIIKKIIDHIVADGQFNESDVTLQELDIIRESLINTLASIHHQRVSYPGFNPSKDDKPDPNEGKDKEPPLPSTLQAGVR